jgi:exodeoxyribonuclease VII large subunit
LVDYAADVRAPTPTAAAEIAVPVLSEIRKMLMLSRQSMYNSINYNINKKLQYIKALSSGLIHPNRLVENYMQRIDVATERLNLAIKNNITKKEELISSYKRLLESYSYKNVINRGFAIIKLGSDIITSVNELKIGKEFTVHLKDGERKITIN